VKLKTIAETYYAIGNRLALGFLRTAARRMQADSYWQRLAQRNFLDGFYDQQMRLTLAALKNGAFEKWLETNTAKIMQHDTFIQDLRGLEYIDTAILMVASRRVESLLPV
jgi:glutamate dehydrogenase